MSTPSTYLTTPIYYVNDKPHLGHCYTTTITDVAARMARLVSGQSVAPGTPGAPVFFLTGTDEHADKVVTSAAERGRTAQDWADENAARFKAAFEEIRLTNDDFIRTSEPRHKDKVPGFIKRLLESGDVYMGDYTGWYDEGQEEYVPENEAREADYKSVVSGRPLVQRTEQNYFFRLSAYADRLKAKIESDPLFLKPDARRNEVLGRIRQGLNDVPISRAVEDPSADVWGVRMPDDPGHRVYVWIDALFNYYTGIDTDERRHLWAETPQGEAPRIIHVLGKDILWFHAVIWPSMLMALGLPLPGCIYAHGWWVAEGRKMSKSLGNFIDLPTLRGYSEAFSQDAVRWYLATQGPLGATDADFAHAKFVEVYNADLANGIGNATSRVGNMIAKYFDGKVPQTDDASGPGGDPDGQEIINLRSEAEAAVDAYLAAHAKFAIDDALKLGIGLVGKVDGFINQTEPFRLAKRIADEPSLEPVLASILYDCAETLRIASLLLAPALPEKTAALWNTWHCSPLVDADNPASGWRAPLAELAAWGHPEHGLTPGSPLTKGDVLFMRADAAAEVPVPVGE